MNAPKPDPERLEHALRRLRELGYLQGPAERYVARRVPAGSSLTRIAGATGFWVGAVGGAAFGLLLTASAVLADPALLDRPADLAWLTLDLVLVMAGLGLAGTLLFTVVILAWLRGRGRSHPPRAEKLALLFPGLVAAIYLTDRLGRHALSELPGVAWSWGALAVSLLAGMLAAAITLVLAAMVATARLQFRGVWRPPRIARWERLVPFLTAAVVSAALLLAGPYGALRPTPFLDEMDPSRFSADHPAGSLTVIAVDGVEGMPWIEGSPRSVDLEPADAREHPAAFWNEVATGFPSEEHGLREAATAGPRGLAQGIGKLREDPILDTVLRHVLPGVGLGVTRATDQRELRRPPFWEIAAHAGRRGRVVNWWATYPAARHAELEVVTDRAVFRAEDGDRSDPNLAQPWSLAERCWQVVSGGMATPTVAPEPYERQALEWIEEHAPDESELREAWHLATRADRVHLDLLLAPVEAQPPALRVLLLNGADILARALERSPAARRDANGTTLRTLYSTFLGALLRTWLDQAQPDGQIWWISSSSVAGGRERRAWTASSPAEAGNGAPPDRIRAWSAAALWQLGLLPARDMPLPVDLEVGGERPVTYGRRPRWTPDAARSAEDLERLRSLGYIGG